MMSKRWLATIVIVVAAVILTIILDTALANHRPAIVGLEATPARISPLGACQIACTASDADEDELSYDWSANGGEINGQGSTVTWHAPRSEGSYDVMATVTDGRGGVVTDYVTIDVRANSPPTINSLTAETTWTLPLGSIQVICDASDRDGDELTYDWIASGGDVHGTGSTVDWSAPQEVSTYNITVVVRDGHGEEAARSAILSVSTGTPPTIKDLIVTANHKYLRENGTGCDYKVGKEQEYDIECIVSDTGGAVSYNWSCGDGEISDISGDGSMITWAAPNIATEVAVTVIVSDVADNRVSKSVLLEVVDCSSCTFR